MTVAFSRRIFLAGSGAGLLLAVGGCGPAKNGAAQATGDLGAWLHVAPDGITTIRVNATDIGQGAQTGLAQIVADELDADWSKVRVEMAPVIDAYFVQDGGGYGTGGSSSIRPQFAMFAKAGATARAMLIAAAAQQWNVAANDCAAKNGAVTHTASGRTLGYGALADAASRIAVPDNVPLKPLAARVLIGKPVARLDIPLKVNGTAVYGIDIKVPGMRIAIPAQCPYFGGKLKSVDEKPALAVKGVEQVVKLDDAVVVIASSFHAAKKGLLALDPQWTRPDDALASGEAMVAALKANIGAADSTTVTLDSKTRDATLTRVRETFAAAPHTVEADYGLSLLAHAPMEPQNATARVTATGCEMWVPTQDQQGMRDAVAETLGLPKQAVTIHTPHVGGGFGRRLAFDYGVLAARVAKASGKTVKVIWTREEDFTHDVYRAASQCRLKAALNADWTIAALDYAGATANDSAIGGLAQNYAIAASAMRQKKTAFQFPIGYWRSVEPGMTVFFMESLVDEIAHQAKLDPLAYRRLLLKGNARGLAVLDAVAAMANWGHAPAGRAQGLAFFHQDSWGTAAAEVVEISVDASNKITLHNVWCAIDPGTAVNPDAVAAQAQGGITLGLSAALGEAITLKDGRVVETNFDTYPVLKMAQAPPVAVRVLQSGDAPGGVGEPPVPPAAPALANAIFAATGRRVRTLPFASSGFTV